MAEAPSRLIALSPAASADHTRHHIAFRWLPFVFVLYITNYLDRTSVAYAAIGMAHDLGFNDRVFGLGIGVFFLSYVGLQIPRRRAGPAVERPRDDCRDDDRVRIADRAHCISSHSSTTLLCTIFVSCGEAGFFTNVIVYLSHWFVHEDRAKATSNFMAAIPVSLIIGSPVAGWILGHNWFMVQGWRWLFFLEGVPAILLGIAALFFLTDCPREATWLTPEQRQWISHTLEEETPAGRRSVRSWKALRSRTVLVLAAAAFLEYFIAYAVIFWLPTILKSESRISDAQLGLLGALP